jgi:hypothetical protein
VEQSWDVQSAVPLSDGAEFLAVVLAILPAAGKGEICECLRIEGLKN